MTSVHARRAKVWKTNEWNAEWIQNAVEYCRQDPDGKRGFQLSLEKEYGKEGARKELARCEYPPARTISGLPPSDGPWWEHVAFDLGLSRKALKMYVDYCTMKDLAAPPRVKPAIKRKRGEGSIQWLSRRGEAYLLGHKPPEMDWTTTRAIALSEIDRVRDTWELWHTSPQAFFDEIFQRGKTIILSPQILVNPDEEFVRLHKYYDAFRGRVFSLTFAHMVWLHASELLEDLFRRGLTTSSHIEREYKKDRHLMLRLIACYTKVEALASHLWSNMGQVISASPNIAPCLVRRRTTTGLPDIKKDESPVGRDAYASLNVLEAVLVDIITEDSMSMFSFCDVLTKELATDPRAADRFDSGTFEIIGEMAVAFEFYEQILQSTFGKGLMSCARTLQGTEDDLWAVLCPMQRPKSLDREQSGPASFIAGPSYLAMLAVRDMWRDVAWTSLDFQKLPLDFWKRLNLEGPLDLLGRIDRQTYLSPIEFDSLWHELDSVLAKPLAKRALPGQDAALAQQFGLYRVDDPMRPTCKGRLLRQWIEHSLDFTVQMETRRAAGVRAPAPAPVIATSQTVAQSGHAYLAEGGSVKVKVKTRKNEHALGPAGETEEDDVDEEDVPEYLPGQFKLGKKVLKVFHRILAEDDIVDAGDENANAPKKGQIRWDAFEKAMRRIGFSVYQTAGSSVRFDPPAKTARPITFHRPHPDAILTPNLIKWCDARWCTLMCMSLI
ncbi:hypothetical protein C8R43DRAFT_1031427 [Mycena crocata]|nr:hypothetical protein C8R43DRAFT_1031427 [Mycena crocata]